MRLIFLKNVWRKNTHASYKFRIQIFKITQRGSHWTFLECLTEWRKYLCAVFLEHPLHSLVHSSLQLIRKYSFFFHWKTVLCAIGISEAEFCIEYSIFEIKFCLISFKHNTLSIHIYTYMNLYFICGNLQYCHIFFATKNFWVTSKYIVFSRCISWEIEK